LIVLRLWRDIGLGGKLWGLGADSGQGNRRLEDEMRGSLTVGSSDIMPLNSCTRSPNLKKGWHDKYLEEFGRSTAEGF
jgi:hypothetical protein